MRVKTIGVPAPIPTTPRPGMPSLLKDLDYSVVQQCMHCGLCLAHLPHLRRDEAGAEQSARADFPDAAIADGRLEATRAFGEEMYFCLGCLACMTACPAGVDYAELFEHARGGGGAERGAGIAAAEYAARVYA